MSLAGYRAIRPPFSTPFAEMTAREARAFFEWFVSEIPSRLSELRHALDQNGGEGVPLDLTAESLEPLGRWLDGHVTMEPEDEARLATARASIPSFIAAWIPDRRVTEETLSLCMDIAIYFGETMRRSNPGVEWSYVRKPKRAGDIHQPVLTPFECGDLNPFQVCRTVVAGVAYMGRSAEEELPTFYHRWEGWVDLPSAGP